MEIDGICLVVLIAAKQIKKKNSTAKSLFRNNDLVTQGKPQTVLFWKYFISTTLQGGKSAPFHTCAYDSARCLLVSCSAEL